MKVLIIDDDKTILSLLKTVFETEFNAEVITAENLIDGIIKYDTEKNIDIVFTDYNLKESSGMDAIIHIGKKTRTVLMSGIMDDVLKKQAELFGADYCLEKPFTIKDIKKIMDAKD